MGYDPDRVKVTLKGDDLIIRIPKVEKPFSGSRLNKLRNVIARNDIFGVSYSYDKAASYDRNEHHHNVTLYDSAQHGFSIGCLSDDQLDIVIYWYHGEISKPK